jgi:hypothetical protein
MCILQGEEYHVRRKEEKPLAAQKWIREISKETDY